ncbi:hypothetical protein ACFYOK_29500 [Microbispora bryophytorum]|uniref:hypothetical protein n=1 Tax=Microbispora bryophytorum TaxID=1460882 RepID=UPI0033DAD828
MRELGAVPYVARLGIVNVMIAGWICDRASSSFEQVFRGNGGAAITYAAMAAAGFAWLVNRLHRQLLRAQIARARCPECGTGRARWTPRIDNVFDRIRRPRGRSAHPDDAHHSMIIKGK